VYTPQGDQGDRDIRARDSMLLHMDGARIFNAAAHLDVPLKGVTSGAVSMRFIRRDEETAGRGWRPSVLQAGVADDFGQRALQGMQFASKMRFIAATFSVAVDKISGRRTRGLCEPAWHSSGRRGSRASREVPSPSRCSANEVFRDAATSR